MGVRIQGRKRRKLRIRKKVNGTPDRPRLSVFRSARHIYAQVVDDTTGCTLVSASTLSKELRGAIGAEPPPAEPPADEGGDEAEAKAKAKAKAKGKGKPARPDGAKTRAARQVGTLLAERCLAKDIGQVVFDRNGYLYHGRVRALAEAARKKGLDF